MSHPLDNFLTEIILKIIPECWQPNHITAVRILLIPVIWALYYLVNPWAATVMFALVAATDFIDGRLARGRNMVTDKGKLLDITCDLALVWSTVLLLWNEDILQFQSHSTLFWLLTFILAREAFVTGVRYLFQVKAENVRVLKVGKCKTAFLMLGLVVLLTTSVWTYGASVGSGLIALAAVCALISGIQYIQQFSRPRLQ